MNDKDSVLRTPSDYHSKDHSFNLTVSFKILLVPLLAVMMSCSVVGAFETDDPYGPVVNCDADQPMDDLLKCVEKEYAWMDRVYETPTIKELKKYEQWDKNDYAILHTNYNRIFEFKTIKECYDKDRCMLKQFAGAPGISVYDQYNGYKIRIDVEARNIGIESYYDYKYNNNLPPHYRRSGWKVVTSSTPTKYVRSNKLKNKDIIISEQGGYPIVYVAVGENIRLQQNKCLVVATINIFCQGELPQWWRGKVPNYTLHSCGIYRFYYVKDHQTGDIPVSISLDKRINPKYIYLKIGKDIFEVDISNDFQLTYE
ncbi:MAG: hypothetical protein IJ525_07095 [Alphaproteobacteria bacterium]|nr:hypothetical protein [Alphaproteobacteria bacterium]